MQFGLARVTIWVNLRLTILLLTCSKRLAVVSSMFWRNKVLKAEEELKHQLSKIHTVSMAKSVAYAKFV
ncbi:hypothetical protein PSSHI_27010 [Photobacterium sp. R1]